MKKRIGSLFLVLALCFTLLPTAAFAADSSKISITTADELLQFAKAVDNGDYDDKTDAVVSLDADLDLKGVAWTPIGSVFAADGTLLHYFSGKFYGNGHTISNLDFSKNYGKSEYPSFGFFSEVYGAEISGLTIQGKLDVSNSDPVFFGTVAGIAVDSKISDCVSDISFTSSEIYLYGYIGLCGYALNSTIEYCQSKGDISITRRDNDPPSLCVGGIVGYAGGASEIRYCANTVNIEATASHVGGIAGSLGSGNPSVTNCYSTGKLIVRGRPYGGNTGGIVGTINGNVPIKHCYFAGGIDLTNYGVTTLPYSRLGGLVGKVESGTPAFENNYFIETEHVTACSKYTDAGAAKSLESMKSEDFFNEITAAGGNYRFNSNGTPLLPAPKYPISFVVTPAELANVVIKVNGQEVANPTNLEAGTYKVEVSADNCAVFTSDIKITTDTATHTQTISMTYLPVDYYEPTYPVTTPDKTENGAVTVSPKNAVSGSTVTVTVTPNSGYTLETLTVTDKNGKELKLTDKGDGKYTFTMPSGKVDIKATFMEDNSLLNFFYDVPNNAYCFDAVKWAVKNGITAGVGDNLFAPNRPCTRAEIVTFLWRAAGSPVVNYAMNMSDIPEGAYYAEAVRWALSEGIAVGTSANTFSPEDTCTRAEAVTFLCRAKGSEIAYNNEFTDVDGDDYYADAVAWAEKNSVTVGVGNSKFAPDDDCSRGQIVTFLYRTYQN